MNNKIVPLTLLILFFAINLSAQDEKNNQRVEDAFTEIRNQMNLILGFLTQ